MKRFSMLCFCGMLITICVHNARNAQAHSAPRKAFQPPVSCAPTGEAWMKAAFDYLNTKPANGKKPAVFATVSLVSLEPGSALGKAPDRTGSWYAHGEVTRYNFPNTWVFEGKFPMWVNNGTDKIPFNGDSSTLGITIGGGGQATFHYQVDGRNRMGKGPQSVNLGAVASGSSDSTLMFSAATEFFGKKLIVVSLTKGEADAAVTPVAVPKIIGARYKVTPSFVVTNSNDGIADNTVEVTSAISIFHNNAFLKWLDIRGDRKKGGRFDNPPFFVEAFFDKPESLSIRVDGAVWDSDELGDDTMWKRQKMSIPLKTIANSKSGKITILPNFALPDDEAQGNLELRIEKIADIS